MKNVQRSKKTGWCIITSCIDNINSQIDIKYVMIKLGSRKLCPEKNKNVEINENVCFLHASLPLYTSLSVFFILINDYVERLSIEIV